ncbi:hypothetical protein CAPN006_05640 [Capnocytophaga canimorsus]|uniref:hypothetical protein n=1 Tax=Capnocytophaga canimorsus TaxID=28188 RepID=UPI001ACDA9C5|nr:hypothetical protein [Capnocytophaga canimorsus]GIM56170.1 hypothetical protein CAPN006_05640 [Capnocytophaga canimorsus]
MNKNIKKEAFSVALFSNKAFVALSLIFLLLITLVFTLVWYLGATGMRPTIAFAACVVFVWSILSSKIYSKKLHFSASHLIVKNVNDNNILKEIKIKSYNSYFFVLKKIGFIIRFYDGDKNHFFFITSKSFLKWEAIEEKELSQLNDFLKDNYPLKSVLIDRVIFIFTYVIYPLIIILLIFLTQKIAYFIKY